MKKITPLESEIQLTVCQYLELKKHFFWRQNTTPVWDRSGGFFRRMPLYAKKGVPDVILVRKGGKVCFLEIKRPNGKLSPDQQLFKIECERLGAEYFMITDVDQLKEIGL